MKRKTALFLLFLAAFFAILFYFSPKNITLAAESDKTGEEQLAESVDKEVERLDTSPLQEFFDSLTSDERSLAGNGEIKTLLKSIAAGNFDGGFNEVISTVVRCAVKSILGFLPALISVIIISVLYGILSGLNSGFLDKSTNQIIYFVCYGAALIILLNEIAGMVNMTVATADKLQKLMYAVFPVMLTMMTALGGVSSVGLTRPFMTIAATFIISFIGSFVIPCFIASVVFTVVGNLSPSVKLGKLSGFFRKLAEWSLGLVFGTFITLLTAKGIVGRTLDGIGVNAAKFAISGYVPVLGGYISDGFDVVMASCILIKNSLGVTGLLLLLSVVLMPIVKLIAFTLCLKFVSAVIEPVSDGKMAEFVAGVSKSMSLLTASLFGLAFMFFAVVMLVIGGCNLGVV